MTVDSDQATRGKDATYCESRMAAFSKRHELVTTYPHKFSQTIRIQDFLEKYSYLTNEQVASDCVEHLCGRVMRTAGSSAKLRFYDLVENNMRVQVMASAADHDETLCEDFVTLHDTVKRGDIVGFIGLPSRTKRGELSLLPSSTIILAPCYHMLPKPHQTIEDQEVRYRNRHLDLIINPSNREVFIIRNRVIQYIRDFLIKKEFIEVETPMMHVIHGGATARPFKTFHNDLDTELFMRVAPELYLKRLVVGGLDRVFEIGKNFRNEGIDLTHNPEFTACEFYAAYLDYYDLMDWTEQMMTGMVMAVHGSLQVEWDGRQIDFTPPFKRVSFVAEIEKQAGVKIPRPLTSKECSEKMIDICNEHKLELPKPATPTKLLDKLCEHFVEDKMGDNPFFIADHPEIMSPLAKYHRLLPEMTERCELFVCGKEVANFYTELNDPIRQRETFRRQVEDAREGDAEAQPYDREYCDVLEYGLPPTAGWGLGIDRMVMFLTGKNNIKEVILFPAMRPQTDAEKATMDAKAKALAEEEEASKGKGKGKAKAQPQPEKSLEDVSRIALKVGKILECWPHPDADKLWCEKIDIGNGEVRQIASGLRDNYTQEEMLGKDVIVVANLPMKKLRGFESHGMVLCASDGDRCEFMAAPVGSPIGEILKFEGHLGEPDDVLPKSSKKDPWPVCQKHFHVKGGQGFYKGEKLVSTSGAVKCASIQNGTMS